MDDWAYFFYYVMLLAAAEWFGHIVKTLFQIYRERLERFQEDGTRPYQKPEEIGR